MYYGVVLNFKGFLKQNNYILFLNKKYLATDEFRDQKIEYPTKQLNLRQAPK